jgi:hypothetical protein
MSAITIADRLSEQAKYQITLHEVSEKLHQIEKALIENKSDYTISLDQGNGIYTIELSLGGKVKSATFKNSDLLYYINGAKNPQDVESIVNAILRDCFNIINELYFDLFKKNTYESISKLVSNQMRGNK